MRTAFIIIAGICASAAGFWAYTNGHMAAGIMSTVLLGLAAKLLLQK